jgi:hypothetical protein
MLYASLEDDLDDQRRVEVHTNLVYQVRALSLEVLVVIVDHVLHKKGHKVDKEAFKGLILELDHSSDRVKDTRSELRVPLSLEVENMLFHQLIYCFLVALKKTVPLLADL